MQDPSWLQPALGYLELKMFAEARQALDSLPEQQRHSSEALELRVASYLDEESPGQALEICRELCSRFPKDHFGYVQGAFCLHEMNRTPEAREWLQSGPPSLQVESVYFYNLGCYDLALGFEESACAWLIQAFEMEPAYYEDALKDPDFQSIMDRIEEMRRDRSDEPFP